MSGRLRLGRAFKPLRRPALWGGLWIAAIAAVVVLSLAPSVPMPDVPDGDKLGHFLAYFALAAAAVQLYARWSALLGAGIGLVLLGIGLEYAQGALTATRMQDGMLEWRVAGRPVEGSPTTSPARSAATPSRSPQSPTTAATAARKAAS